ncbi:MAG: sporulation protein YqfD [Clostridia bacterium]|nr:sporulation protein YqfD [Clostridia bacterium]
MTRFLRFLFGYVVFSFYGAFPERFINEIGREGIDIWDTRCDGGVYYSCTFKNSYRRLKPIAKRNGVRMRALMQAGLPLYIEKYKRRFGMLVGAAIFAAILIIHSRYIWIVEVSGCETLSQSTVTKAMSELGIFCGADKSTIDARMVSERARLMLPDVSWIYVNMKGCYARIELKERTYEPEMDNSVCNVVASEDGQIVSMEVYSGHPAVKTGDGAAKGDLLVSGAVEDKYGKTELVRASAKITARVKRDYEITVPFVQSKSVETGDISKFRRLRFFNLDLPLYLFPPPEYGHSERTETLPLRLYGKDMPIALTTTETERLEEILFEIDESRALRIAGERLEEITKNELSDCSIIDIKTDVSRNVDSLTLNARIICEKNIAIQQNFIVN